MKLDDRVFLLKDEYLFLQQDYEDIDKKCLNIKGWNITLVAILIVAGFEFSGFLFLVGAIASVVFWYIEAYYRGLTFFIKIRIKMIEKAFQNNDYLSVTPFQLYSTWEETYKKCILQNVSQTKKYSSKRHVFLPHLFITIICLILFVAKLASVV
jgi:hypothetical protein